VGRLTGIDTVLLLDLDGTLYVGSQVVPGAPETVRWLRAQGLTVRFTTNTDSISPTALADRLAGPGERATHGLVADPGHGATYDDLDAAFRALRSRRNWSPPRSTGLRAATTASTWTPAAGCGCWSTPPARPLGCWASPRRSSSPRPPNALGRGAQSALVVGDDLAADIGGHTVGAATVQVRSGKGDRPQPGAGAEPDAVVDASPTCPDCSKPEYIRPAPQ
jgi:ribonucleotide monophosphatase NagD (HAD superfamily)